MWTRPEPTIFGNCDGWDFIVGKKAAVKALKICILDSLQGSNMKIINSLLTISKGGHGQSVRGLWIDVWDSLEIEKPGQKSGPNDLFDPVAAQFYRHLRNE